MVRRIAVLFGVLVAGSLLQASPPQIRALFPEKGSPGDLVTILGKGFSYKEEQDIVKFGTGETAVQAEVRRATSYSICAVVPNLDPAEYPVTVTVKTDTTEETSQEQISFTVVKAEPPAIEEILPESGPAGTSVKIIGQNLGHFGNKVTVLFGTIETAGTSWWNAIYTRVPEAAPLGETQVSVKIGDMTSNSVPFTVTEPPPPVIDEIHPVSGPAGTLVRIYGENLSSRSRSAWFGFGQSNFKWMGGNGAVTQAKVLFGTAEAKIVYCSSHEIGAVVPVVEIPEGQTEVQVDVTVVVGTRPPSNAVKFTVTEAPAPVVESLSPATGPVGTRIVIKGENLGGHYAEQEVLFDQTPATHVCSGYHGTSLFAMVPEGLEVGKQYAVTVKVNGVLATLAEGASPLLFTVEALPTPVIESIDPTSGPVGTYVKIVGQNLGAMNLHTKVFFGDVEASRVYAHPLWEGFTMGDSENKWVIVAAVPAGLAAGAVKVKVTIGGIASNEVDFEVTASP